MKSRNWIALLIFLVASLPSARLGADGLPYSHDRVMHAPFVGLPLSDAQVREISTAGLVTFDERSLRLLRKFYPEFPKKVAVASSTFNDNLERFDGDCADVIWWFADEIRVILTTPGKGEPLCMPETERPWTPSEATLFRLSPDAEIFHQGKKITIIRALEVVESAGARAQPDRDDLRIILPPPHSAKQEVELSRLEPEVRKMVPDDPEKNDVDLLVQKIFDRLVAHGETRGLRIFKSW